MQPFKYSGNGVMDVIFFFSGGASSMQGVLESPDHGRIYRVVGALTNRTEKQAAKGYDIARQFGVEVVHLDPQDFDSRVDFYRAVAERVDAFEPDVVGLSGWLKKYSMISDPFLTAYGNRIVNVHPADLSVLAELNGQHPLDIGRKNLKISRAANTNHDRVRIYRADRGWERMLTGDDAVNLAVLLGEKEVCSTIHSVTDECDGGPILVQSKRFPVDTGFVDEMLRRNALDRIADYAHGLQGEMKTKCDKPAFCTALKLLAESTVGIANDFVTRDDKPMPYGGYQMDAMAA